MHKINIIDDARELAEWLGAIDGNNWAAIDTEFLRTRTYVPQLCLIQIATGTPDGQIATCIDALAIEDLSPLGKLLANPHVVKIFHSCQQDFESLDTRVPLQVNSLYDTQLAAAFCGYGEQVSYAALVETLCAVHLPKLHTRADWSRRPLPLPQLEYALDDVQYLPQLRLQLDQLLAQKGRLAWFREECIKASAPSTYRFATETAGQRLKGTSRLTVAGQICAKKLAVWREQKARDRNLPRGWILSTPLLLKISRVQPNTLNKLAKINEINARFVKHRGREIVAIVQQSETEAEQAVGMPSQILTAQQKHMVTEVMHLLERCAKREEISRLLLANRQEVEQFARGVTDLPLFKGWRAQLVGNTILTHYQ